MILLAIVLISVFLVATFYMHKDYKRYKRIEKRYENGEVLEFN